ncbi:MAG TPA: 30S ribosome-binding factor RbfA [Clostridiales bacterium]|nr:30S ribosome-binding factor RbfA [Clostridiales bacterium]
MSQRSERISEEFQKALSESIRTLKDPRVHEAMVSVTRCEVTGDLRYAKAFISVFGSDQQKKDVMRGLKSASGFLRREVASAIRLRYAPEILFTLDESITHGAHINKMLHDLEKEGKL